MNLGTARRTPTRCRWNRRDMVCHIPSKQDANSDQGRSRLRPAHHAPPGEEVADLLFAPAGLAESLVSGCATAFGTGVTRSLM